MEIVYFANIIVAGWISITCLVYPKTDQLSIFENAFVYSEAIRLVGALWGAIFILSILGLFFPLKMSLVLLFPIDIQIVVAFIRCFASNEKSAILSKRYGNVFCDLGIGVAVCDSLELFVSINTDAKCGGFLKSVTFMSGS